MTSIIFRDGVSAEVDRVSDDDEFIVRYCDDRDGSSWTAAHSEETLRKDFLGYIIRDILEG
mgnify:CR=1 FL=1